MAKNADQETSFAITDTKCYVPVVNVSSQDNRKMLEELKFGKKTTIKSKKYQSKNQQKDLINI